MATLVGLLCLVATPFCLSAFLSWTKVNPGPDVRFVVAAAYYSASILILLRWQVSASTGFIEQISFRLQHLPVSLLLSVLLLVAAFFVALVASQYCPGHSFCGSGRHVARGAPEFLTGLDLVFPLFLGPIYEELLFRGVLLSVLSRLVGNPPAILISSVIFGALHYPGGGLVIVGAFLMGCALCLVTIQQRSLTPALLAHLIVNFSVHAINVELNSNIH